MEINTWLKINNSRLIQIRRYLHSNPELGFKEEKTSSYLQKILQNAGYGIHRNSDMQKGFYIEYGNVSGPILAIRCDLDALPIQDVKDDVPYKSKNKGIMHACGHDAHMSIATGLALFLKENNILFSGKVRIIYQPAEETAPGGAVEMIKGGAIKDVNNIIGYHVYPKMEPGHVGIKEGSMSAAVEAHNFTFNGRGGHTSRPEETEDLILIISKFIAQLNLQLEKIKNNSNQFIMTFGHIKGGHTYNVIPDSIKLLGTLRFFNNSTKIEVHNCINTIIDDFKSKLKIEIDHIIPHSSPPVINDNKMTNLFINSSKDTINDDNLHILDQPSMGGEDFSYYLSHCPGIYFRVGCSNGYVNDLHTPNFDLDESCISTGISVLNSVVKLYFN